MPDPFVTLSSGGPSAELFLLWHCQEVLAGGGNGIGQSMEKFGAVRSCCGIQMGSSSTLAPGPTKHGDGHHEGAEERKWEEATWIWILEGLGMGPSTAINHMTIGQSLYYFIWFLWQ